MHIAESKSPVSFRTSPEKGQDLLREQEEDGSLQSSDEKGVSVDQGSSLFDSVIVTGAVVKAHDGLAAYTAPDNGRIEQKVDFGHNAGPCQGLTPAVN